MDETGFLDLGERLTRALTTGDFDLFQQVMDLPLDIEPRGGSPYRLETVSDLRKDFDLYRDHITLHGITDIHRDVLQVEPLGADRTIVICRMNILAGGARVVPPFGSMMTMRRDGDGEIRFCKIQSSLGHINWTLGAGGITDGDFDLPAGLTIHKDSKPNGGSNG